MKFLPALVLLGFLSLTPRAQAQATITFNPVSGDNTKFVVSGSGTMTGTTVTTGDGHLSFVSVAAPWVSDTEVDLFSSAGTGTFGGVTVSGFGIGRGPFNDPSLKFTFSSALIGSGPFSFTSGTLLTGVVPNGSTYATFFNEGSFSPSHHDSLFNGGSGTTVIVSNSAVPEASTYAALIGLGAIGFAVTRRSRRRG